ncbi:uncharacterized protein LOC123313096 isoform X3 [Coccinella septempunctata]|uniref:uncharacterized protein LOC123313096 isoform X2 n=1 Tax=Coccinella septempunctata TaxID=41139 RepID=UPI001D06E4FE|nr:uncharacterized protein LOC123313096 isoform X2 [Coccinella septempunctata]XP_044753746.1 uncharacterized protein LOC123313096 isoform X3 [Coccinella septempunctata]
MSSHCQTQSYYQQILIKTNMIKTLLVLLVSISSAYSQSNSDYTFNRVKRTDIDLSTCIDNFDIHKDKIIRTQDSQKMGAKYLNAIDLGSRQECLRLCCETENCDVFVYEDKNAGSCYLFHCGPPEDFKCKFTHHVNYSSAVLAINRHIPDLESQIKLTKHEQDLTKLRKTENDPEPAPHILEEKPPTSVTTSTTVKTIEILPDQKETPNDKKCSRYQFECRSTRECIAIYNACDGIPQCADGSDEAPELSCPELSTPAPPPPQRTVVNNPPPVATYDKNVVSTKNQEAPPPVDIYHVAPPRAEIIPDEQLAPANNPDFLRTLPQDQRPPQRLPPYPELPEYSPQAPQLGWNSHQSNQLYPMPPVYSGKTSHIFNHKENGLQVPESEISSYSDNLNYPKVPNYFGETYRQPIDAPNWVNAHQDDLRYPTRYNPDPAYGSRPVSNPQEKYTPQEKIPNWPAEKENPEHIQIKMAHELKHSKEAHTEEHKDIKIKIVETPAENKKDVYPDVVAYKMDGNDGVAQTPGGAVLSLTFGLMITCIMAVMIACRLRIVKRRTRKSGKSYAHDADYLVNGMYL